MAKLAECRMIFSRVKKRWLVSAFLLVAGLAAAQQATKPVTILHTNDLHARLEPFANGNGGFAYLAATIRREKANCKWCLVLDCGDLVQGTPVSTLFDGVPIYDVANHLGIQASTLGNHEYDYGWQKVGEYQRTARFPIVSANLVDEKQNAAARPYVILEADGVRVGVIGAITSDFPRLHTPDQIGKWRALPVVETVRRYIQEVRDQSHIIVLLGHLSEPEEAQVLNELPEVAVTIGGHIHAGLTEPKRAGDRLLVRVKAGGVELGRVDLEVDLESKAVVSAKWTRIPVGVKYITPARDVAAVVAAWESKVAKLMNVPIGESKREFGRPELKALFEKALAEEMGVDFAFIGRGGIRAELHQGTILVRHVWMIYPFDSRVVIGRFRGSQLPAVVTAGRQIDPNRQYTLLTNEFTATNQSSPRELNTSGLKFPRIGPRQRDLLVQWVKKKRVLE